MQTLLILATLLVCAVLAYEPSRTLSIGRVHAAHPCVSRGSCIVHDYSKVAKLAADDTHSITVWLNQNALAANCPALLEEVSNPASPKYGQHYTFEQIHDLAWNQQAIDAVTQYLRSNGMSLYNIAPNGEYISVTAPVSSIETAFSTQLYEFHSETQHKSIKRGFSYIVPSEIMDHVHFIASISNFPMYSPRTNLMAFSNKRDSEQTAVVTPKLIFNLYNLPNHTDATPKSDQAVFESLGQSFSPADLTQFQKLFNLPQNPVKKVIGPNKPADCAANPGNCAEASLDVQWITALAWDAPTIYWSVDPQGDIFLTFIQQVAANPAPPKVYSISYGGPEHLQDPNAMTQFNTEACKMGLRGLTFFASSGDDGVAGFEARANPSKCAFNPEFPALSPFVTSVGATMGPESGKPEVACTTVPGGSIITTGGGFSKTFTRPAYQDAQVKAYLSNPNANLPPTTMFASGGRAFPDIGALGNSFLTVIGGQQYLLSGTSASSPVFCAMVTLINGQREVVGKKPLGFLNPLLYSTQRAGIFNDISSGINNCCAGQQNPVCCKFGFTAAPGWDPLTGLGSIDFVKLAAALDNLP